MPSASQQQRVTVVLGRAQHLMPKVCEISRLCDVLTNFCTSDQFIDISGEHKFVAPGPGDIRGPCPGLNAAANHGFLPRNGIASIEQTVSGLGALYNLGPQISAVLAAYAVAIDGNVVEGVWSIGGPLPKDDLTSK